MDTDAGVYKLAAEGEVLLASSVVPPEWSLRTNDTASVGHGNVHGNSGQDSYVAIITLHYHFLTELEAGLAGLAFNKGQESWLNTAFHLS